MDSRRDFLKKALGATLVAAAGPIVCACGAKVFAEGIPAEVLGTIQIKSFLKTYTKLKAVNGSIVYSPPSPNKGRPIVITCKAISPYTFSVLTAVCTHQGTTVQPYNGNVGYIYCTNHGSKFSVDGSVIQGPAVQPLAPYTWNYDDVNDIMSISGSKLTDGVADQTAEAFLLEQNYPNPFTDRTALKFTLPSSGRITLSVSDALGREVAVVAEGMFSSGSHTVEFNGASLATGTYFYKLVTENGTLVKQMARI